MYSLTDMVSDVYDATNVTVIDWTLAANMWRSITKDPVSWMESINMGLTNYLRQNSRTPPRQKFNEIAYTLGLRVRWL